jgi:hypothetical protein
VTTAATSMHSATNWRMRLRGRSLIVCTGLAGGSRGCDPGCAAISGGATTIARAVGERHGTPAQGQDDARRSRLTVCSRGRAPGIVDSSDDVAAAVGYVVERSLLDQRQIAVIMELFLWQADDADRLRRESRCSTLGGASSSRCSAARQPRGR